MNYNYNAKFIKYNMKFNVKLMYQLITRKNIVIRDFRNNTSTLEIRSLFLDNDLFQEVLSFSAYLQIRINKKQIFSTDDIIDLLERLQAEGIDDLSAVELSTYNGDSNGNNNLGMHLQIKDCQSLDTLVVSRSYVSFVSSIVILRSNILNFILTGHNVDLNRNILSTIRVAQSYCSFNFQVTGVLTTTTQIKNSKVTFITSSALFLPPSLFYVLLKLNGVYTNDYISTLNTNLALLENVKWELRTAGAYNSYSGSFGRSRQKVLVPQSVQEKYRGILQQYKDILHSTENIFLIPTMEEPGNFSPNTIDNINQLLSNIKLSDHEKTFSIRPKSIIVEAEDEETAEYNSERFFVRYFGSGSSLRVYGSSISYISNVLSFSMEIKSYTFKSETSSFAHSIQQFSREDLPIKDCSGSQYLAKLLLTPTAGTYPVSVPGYVFCLYIKESLKLLTILQQLLSAKQLKVVIGSKRFEHINTSKKTS